MREKHDSGSYAKRRSTLSLLISAAVLLSAAAIAGMFLIMPKQRLAKELALGEKYLEELNYDEAILHFQEALRIDPRSLDASMGLGDANYGLAESVAGEDPAYAVLCYQRAADSYETVLEISPGSVFLENRVSQIRRKSDEMKGKAGKEIGKPENAPDFQARPEQTVTPTRKPTVTPAPSPTLAPTATPMPTNTPTPEPKTQTETWTITKSTTELFGEFQTRTYTVEWEPESVHTVVAKLDLHDDDEYYKVVVEYEVDFDDHTIEMIIEAPEGEWGEPNLIVDLKNRVCYTSY